MKKLITILALGLLTAGCAEKKYTVTHDWKGQSDYQKDVFECETIAMGVGANQAQITGSSSNFNYNSDPYGLAQNSQQAVNAYGNYKTRQRFFDNCMAARGWVNQEVTETSTTTSTSHPVSAVPSKPVANATTHQPQQDDKVDVLREMVDAWAEYTPKKVDEITTLVSFDYAEQADSLIYQYEMDIAWAPGSETQRGIQISRRVLAIESACLSPMMKILETGTTLVHHVYDLKGDMITSFKVSSQDCYDEGFVSENTNP